MTDASKNAGKKRGRPFSKGHPGGPGRPQGSRNKATLALEKLLDGQAEAITQKAVDLALDGDTTALRLCLERLCPPRKDRPINITLPKIEKAEDSVKACAVVLQAVADGEITPTEGHTLAGLLGEHRRLVEIEDIERRLSSLENTRGSK